MPNPPFNKPPFGGQQYNGDENPPQPPFGQQQQQGGFPPAQNNDFPQQNGFPQQGQHQNGFPQQSNNFPPTPQQQGGFPPAQNNGFPSAPQQGGFPSQQNGFPPQGQPNQFPPQAPQSHQGGFPNGFPPAPQQGGFPPQGPNGFPPAPQNDEKGNKKLFIIIASIVAGLAVLIGLVAVVAGFLGGGDEQNNTDGSAGTSETVTTPEQAINLDPVESTDNAGNDQRFNEVFPLLDIEIFDVNQGRGVALDTCAYLATDPSAADFQKAIENSGTEYFEIGKAIGAGMEVYCPSDSERFYELLEA